MPARFAALCIAAGALSAPLAYALGRALVTERQARLTGLLMAVSPAALMFGGGLSIPVPDLDRTDYLLLLGANPLVSNGSLMTAPDMRGRLRRLRQSRSATRLRMSAPKKPSTAP